MTVKSEIKPKFLNNINPLVLNTNNNKKEEVEEESKEELIKHNYLKSNNAKFTIKSKRNQSPNINSLNSSKLNDYKVFNNEASKKSPKNKERQKKIININNNNSSFNNLSISPKKMKK